MDPMNLRPFQRRFVSAATRRSTRRAALSLPRANGKSWLAGYLAAEALRPGGRLWVPGAENVLLSGSLDQARFVYRFARDLLADDDAYSFLDSTQAVGIRHKATGTRLVVRSSRARSAFGIVGARIAIADEPGAWDTVGGQMMADALDTSLGKPGSPLTVIYIGTLAPAVSGWWHTLVKGGSGGSTYVQSLIGDPSKWDRWSEIRRCNPLVSISRDFAAELREERDKARADETLRARFISYRLNAPSRAESEVLFTVPELERIMDRPAAPREGAPIVGIDLGGGRSWSAACAVWRTGRVEAFAVAPGVPDLGAQERRDRADRGAYRQMHAQGALHVADGLRVPPVDLLVSIVADTWGPPAAVLCDRFRLAELQDAAPGWPLEPRRGMWSEASEDVRGTRRLGLDGPLSVAPGSRSLFVWSLMVSRVETDDAGNARLVKRALDGRSKDDVAQSLVLAAGAAERCMRQPAPSSGRVRTL